MELPKFYDYESTYSAPLPTPNGGTVTVSMQGWYWNILDLIFHVTDGKRRGDYFVQIAEDKMHVWRVTFDEAVRHAIYEYFEEYRRWREIEDERRRNSAN